MSIQALTWCVRQTCPTPTSKLILFVLSNYADHRHSCFPSEKHIGKVCGVSPRTVRRCLSQLSKNQLITINLRKGTSNRYVLSMDADGHTSMDAGDRSGRSAVTAYTKDIHKKTKRRSLNELAG